MLGYSNVGEFGFRFGKRGVDGGRCTGFGCLSCIDGSGVWFCYSLGYGCDGLMMARLFDCRMEVVFRSIFFGVFGKE